MVCVCGGAALSILTGDPPAITVNSALVRAINLGRLGHCGMGKMDFANEGMM
jgi:hypothetical protein